LAEFPSWN